MGFDLRYNLMHIGDNFSDAVHKTADTAIQCSKAVFFSYDIQMLQRKKNKAAREVGERVSALVKEGTVDISQDLLLSGLIAKLDLIEKELAAQESARTDLMSLFTIKKTACACTANPAGKE
ncbi:MAG TPA: hypothetical protein HPP95_06795 [Deltaproteobacteria bacterium]|nr:hypothetical protein [Deltaproteobacteria bacterium]